MPIANASATSAFDVGGVSYFETLFRDARGEGCSSWDADTIANALQWAAYFGRAVAKIDHTSRQKLMAAFDEAFQPAPLFDVSPSAAQACLIQTLLASPFLPPAHLPGLMSRIATISRRSAKPAVSSISNNAVASAADGCDATASEILAAAQRGAVEVSGMACIGAATAAIMPLLQPEKRFSRMRAHARAAAAALVLTLDEHLIEELCSLVSQSEELLFFEFVLELLGVTPTDVQSVIQAITDVRAACGPCASSARHPHFLGKLQAAVETCLLASPQRDAALVSVAAARCIACRPLCRSAATIAWSQRLLHVLNTSAELLLLPPPAAAHGSFSTFVPDSAAVCVQALVETVNAAPPLQRAELLRLARDTVFAQPVSLASHSTAQAAFDTLSARIFIPSTNGGRQR